MNPPVRSMVPEKPFHLEEIAAGIALRRLYPGGKAGPDNVVANAIPGGQTWSESIMLGNQDDAFQLLVPDIRMPPNQIWPMHWHDCWTSVVVIEGGCLIGDWYMVEGDVFIAAPSVEYGPLLIGPKGCRLLEVFGDLALSPGGYSPEYRDHPTLQGGNHVFKPREGINCKNEGHSALSPKGAEGMSMGRLEAGRQWDFGAPGDPGRGVMRDTRLAVGETVAARTRGDWHAMQVLAGSIEVGGKVLTRDDVLISEPGAAIPDVRGGKDGAHLIEYLRTARAL